MFVLSQFDRSREPYKIIKKKVVAIEMTQSKTKINYSVFKGSSTFVESTTVGAAAFGAGFAFFLFF